MGDSISYLGDVKIPQNQWVHMLRSLSLSELFYIHFPGRGSHFSKGDHSKNAKGPGLHNLGLEDLSDREKKQKFHFSQSIRNSKATPKM